MGYESFDCTQSHPQVGEVTNDPAITKWRRRTGNLTQNPYIAAGYRLKVFFTSLPSDHLWTRLNLVLNILYLARTTGMMSREDDQG